MAKKFCAGLRKPDISRLGKSKGSVLFFVIAIMSVLIIMASAVYYAVNSATQEVQIKYANEQAYQSAIAINDMVSDYIAADPNAQFISSAMALTAGDSIQTTLVDLGPAVGNVKVTITKISGNGDSAILSITTESEVDGQKQVVTSVGELTVSELESEPASLTRFFTSTGYVPNDTLFSSGTITSELFLDSEYTEFGGQNGGAYIDISAGIISSGSVRFNNVPLNSNQDTTFDITIGNDFYVYGSNAGIGLCGGTLRVGGSFFQLTNYKLRNGTTPYILGDFYSASNEPSEGEALYINGDMVLTYQFVYTGDIYVNGDVYIGNNFNAAKIAEGKMVIGGNIYASASSLNKTWYSNLDPNNIKGRIITVTDTADLDFSISQDTTVYEMQEQLEGIRDKYNSGAKGYTYIWPSSSSEANPCESVEAVRANINKEIGAPNYINWDLEKLFHVGEDVNNPLIEETVISFDSSNSNHSTVTLSAADSDKYVLSTFDIPFSYGKHAIIFDTSDGAGGYKDIYVYLKPNFKYDENGKMVFKQFMNKWRCTVCSTEYPSTAQSWEVSCPSCGAAAWQQTSAGVEPVEGSGDDFDCFMFSDTTNLSGNEWDRDTQPFSVLCKGKGSVVFVIPEGVTFVAQQDGFIGHYALYELLCGDVDENNIEYTSLPDFNIGASWQAVMAQLTGYLDFETGLYTQMFLDKTGDSGDKTYVHNNIFLVSVEKNVEVNFDVQQTAFAGLIYAPYMQFDFHNNASKRLLLGGLVASNYGIEGSGTCIYAAPYDYYDRFVPATNSEGNPLTEEEKEAEREKYLAYLMGKTGNNSYLQGGGGGSIGRGWVKFGYN